MSDDIRLGEMDLDVLDKVADRMIVARDGASDTWGRCFKLALQEIRDTRKLLNTPRTDEFIAAVRIEAAHQVERWGTEHDAGKRVEDWITLFMYLLGKAAKAHFDGNRDKLLHHVITVAAVALNMHRNLTGDNTRMRPGVGP